MRKVLFSEVSVCSQGGGGVTPSPSHNTSTGPMSFPGGGGVYPIPRWNGVFYEVQIRIVFEFSRCEGNF